MIDALINYLRDEEAPAVWQEKMARAARFRKENTVQLMRVR
jgi:hypothetical protein